MALEVLDEERFDQPRAPLRLVAPAPEPEPRVVIKRVFPDQETLQILTMLGNVVSVRLMLFAAVLCAGWLAYLAMPSPEPGAIWLLAIFAVLVIGPLTWLAQKRS